MARRPIRTDEPRREVHNRRQVMFVTKKFLPRRTFLRGMGVSIALPFFDAMAPALTAMVKTAANPKRRLGFVYVPNGMIMEQWTPPTVSDAFEFTPLLKPFEPFRSRLDGHRPSVAPRRRRRPRPRQCRLAQRRDRARRPKARTSGSAARSIRSSRRRSARTRRSRRSSWRPRTSPASSGGAAPDTRAPTSTRCHGRMPRHRCRWRSIRGWCSSGCSAAPARASSAMTRMRTNKSVLDSIATDLTRPRA